MEHKQSDAGLTLYRVRWKNCTEVRKLITGSGAKILIPGVKIFSLESTMGPRVSRIMIELMVIEKLYTIHTVNSSLIYIGIPYGHFLVPTSVIITSSDGLVICPSVRKLYL